jgi:hypothetical protein
MIAPRESDERDPAPEPPPVLEAWPGEDEYSASEEDEIAARLEALGYLD